MCTFFLNTVRTNTDPDPKKTKNQPPNEIELEARNVVEVHARDVRELLNYRKAFEFVSEYLEDGGPITEGLVREIHKRLVEGVRGGVAAPGEYRKIQNYVDNSVTGETVYTPPPAHDVPIMMAELGRSLRQVCDNVCDTFRTGFATRTVALGPGNVS